MTRIACVLTLFALTVGSVLAARVASSGNTVELDETAQQYMDAEVKPAKVIGDAVMQAGAQAVKQALKPKPVRQPTPGKAVWFPHTGPRPQGRPQPPRQPISGKAVWFPHTGPRPVVKPQPPQVKPQPVRPQSDPLNYPTGTEPSLPGAVPQPPRKQTGDVPLIVQALNRPQPRPPQYPRPMTFFKPDPKPKPGAAGTMPGAAGTWLAPRPKNKAGAWTNLWPLLLGAGGLRPWQKDNLVKESSQPSIEPEAQPENDADGDQYDPDWADNTEERPNPILFPPSLWPFPRPNVGPEPALMAGAALVAGTLFTTEPPPQEASETDVDPGNLHTLEYGSQATDTAGRLHHTLSNTEPDQSGDDLSNPVVPANFSAPAGDTAGPDLTPNLEAAGVLNVGDECAGACDGGPCRYCGTGFCCKKGSFRGGCDGLSGGVRHICVAPPNVPAPMNLGMECWNAADCRSGRCGYCGSGLCCRMGVAEGGCDGSVGGTKNHHCVAFEAFSYGSFVEPQSVAETSEGDSAGDLDHALSSAEPDRADDDLPSSDLTSNLQVGSESVGEAGTANVKAEDENEAGSEGDGEARTSNVKP